VLEDRAEPRDKAVTVGIVVEYLPPLNAAADNVMDSSRSIYSRLTRHNIKLATQQDHQQCTISRASPSPDLINKTIGLRVEKEDEIIGLDQTLHSESAYN